MTIVMNLPCPECQKHGADKHGKYLMVFENGAKLCIHTHNHTSGERYYEKPDGSDPVFDREIDGKVQYSPEQFKKLYSDGKLKDSFTRNLAMSGMRMKDRYAVMDDTEKTAIEDEWAMDVSWFKQLKVMSLIDRNIHGLIAKLYDVRVGHGADGTIARHYTPVHDRESLEVIGAKARTLPKDFRCGHLGRRFGDTALFGMHTTQAVLDSGTFRKGKMGKLLVVGGECDAMASQQMIVKALNKLPQMGSVKSLDGLKLAHVWSPTKGETCLEEVVANRQYLEQFEEIVWGFDNDDVGNKLNLACSRLFRQQSKFFIYPQGCKDANQCLMEGREKEFIDAWWQPAEARVKGKIKTVGAYKDKASIVRTMGLDYFEPALNDITFGIQLRYLGVWGAGTGVGKTEITTQFVHSLMKQGQSVVAIYLENSPEEVVQMFAGMLKNKDFTSPPLAAGELYNASRDYTPDDLKAAIEELEESGLLYIPDLEGCKDIDVILEVLSDAYSMGHHHFVIDNLTAFEHRIDGKVMTGVTAIDTTMKSLGNFKDENDVHIMLLAHLTRPERGRVPHELGGEVFATDFRGAGSITFWANGVWSIERNTLAETLTNKCTTLIRNLKSRGVGYKVGTTVVLIKDLATGKFKYLKGVHQLPEVGRDEEKPSKQPSPMSSVADNLINDIEF